MSEPSRMRIGDAERDEAVTLLTEHLTAGRLDHAEFDERLGNALAAHTRGDLDAIFDDLPGRRPGDPSATPPAPLPVLGEVEPAEPEKRWHWWTSSLLFFIPLALSIFLGEFLPWMGALIVPAALWVWWIGPNVAAGFDQRDREIERRKLRERRQLGDR